MNRRVSTMPAHAYMLSWKQLEQDRRDADLIATFMATKAAGLRTHQAEKRAARKAKRST